MATKEFDVALVDPHDPSIEHWPRVRVQIDEASVDDLTDAQKQPPAGGESAEGEAKRLAFLVRGIERERAIGAYNERMGLTDSHLRYDVVEAVEGSPEPALPERWVKHLRDIGLMR